MITICNANMPTCCQENPHTLTTNTWELFCSELLDSYSQNYPIYIMDMCISTDPNGILSWAW